MPGDLLKPHPSGTPLPSPSGLSGPFWQGCALGELRFQRCDQCGAAVFNPAPRCRSCRSAGLVWELSNGTGSLYSWTVVWRPQTPAFEVPYAPAIVELDEGYHMISNVIGCPAQQLSTGMRLVVEFHDAGHGVQLPYFRPAVSGAAIDG